MRDGPTNRVEMIVVGKSVVRRFNMVAAMRLVIIAKSACLHGVQHPVVTAKKR